MSQKVKFHKGPVWYVVQLVILADGNIDVQKEITLTSSQRKPMRSVGMETKQTDTLNSQSQGVCGTPIFASFLSILSPYFSLKKKRMSFL